MCGIIAIAAQRNILPILVEGLRRLEYRGYDSCGIAMLVNGGLTRTRSVARVEDLAKQIYHSGLYSEIGIAHTRWATHGKPVTYNAHPIFSRDTIGVVHNGVIENYEFLRARLLNEGYKFESQTDTEVIAHLIHSYYNHGNLSVAVRNAVSELRGTYAIAVIAKDKPNRIVGARVGSPLVVGFGKGENFLASDSLALVGNTNSFAFLEEGDIADLTLEGVYITDINGKIVSRKIKRIDMYTEIVQLQPFQHFMQKEIFEQPQAIKCTLKGLKKFDASLFGNDANRIFSVIEGILILACGTSYYSGLCAKYWLEAIAGIPVQVEIASEYCYRVSVPRLNDLVIVISQSGETADTISAVKHAKSLGHLYTLAICNVAMSTIMRTTNMSFLTCAGTEIGVASTKAFTTQLVALFLLTVTLGKIRGYINKSTLLKYLQKLDNLPNLIKEILNLEPQITKWSNEIAKKENVLFLGRGIHYPIALEGALKLKEISYIHAEAYAAGELKHGPLALVTEELPIVVLAPNNELIKKLKSNIQEVKARGGKLYILADSDTNIEIETNTNIIQMPKYFGVLSPILHIIPLQLLAYHTACKRGTDVDKPRNLAKSVTVE